MKLNKKQGKIYDWLLSKPGYLKKSALTIQHFYLEKEKLQDIYDALRAARSHYAEMNKPKSSTSSFKDTVWGKKLQAAKLQISKQAKIKRLFFDIETSPNVVYTWNIGYDLKIDYHNIIKERAIICICYKWEGDDKVYYLRWDKGDDKKMVKDFFKIIEDADEVIGHNSDKFDIKWFKARALFHGILSMPEFKSIDTLKMSRQNFKFNSHRLDYIGQFLGLGKKEDTGGFALWKEIIETNSEAAIMKMINYCKNDVILLEKVYNTLKGYSKPKTHIGVLQGKDKCSCPSCGSEHTHSKGNTIAATGTIKRKYQCQNCGHYFTISKTADKKDKK